MHFKEIDMTVKKEQRRKRALERFTVKAGPARCEHYKGYVHRKSEEYAALSGSVVGFLSRVQPGSR